MSYSDEWEDEERSPWDEEEPPGEQGVLRREAPVLYDVFLRFAVRFATERAASTFVRCFGLAYTRSATTARGRTAWLNFRCAAADAADAAVQAAVAIRRVTEEKRLMLGGARPEATRFHEARVTGPVASLELVRAHQEREAALAKAREWGLTYDSLVAQASGQPLLPERRSDPLERSPAPADRQLPPAATGET
jgi:hypothetical protein